MSTDFRPGDVVMSAYDREVFVVVDTITLIKGQSAKMIMIRSTVDGASFYVSGKSLKLIHRTQK